jgi:regulator of protease activity HflC (stomatin/prohibitin superfamily)
MLTPKAYGQDMAPRTIVHISLGIVIGLWVLITIGSIVHIVDNGHVGLVYTFGGITGQRGDGSGGMVVTFPWQSVQQANVQVQKVVPDTACQSGDVALDNCLTAASNETQDVFIQAVVNIHVDPVNIQELYRNVGPDYVNKLVQSRMAQITKEETAKLAATDVIPSRAALRTSISQRLTSDLSKNSIIVDDFLLTNIEFTPQFNQAIEAKVTAEQNAITEQNNVEVEKAKADQVRAQAKGQADANQIISDSLTPELIQYQMVSKLSPNISVVGIPIGQGTIFDLGNLLLPKTPDQPTVTP